MITIIKDKPLINDVYQYDVILVGTSIMNALGNGFQQQIKVNFPLVNEANKSTNYADKRKLGTVKVINDMPIFCLCYINKGNYRSDIIKEYLDYDALAKCLTLINDNFQGKKIASTIIGLSKYEGNGDKDKILSIIENTTKDIDITLYDFEQSDWMEDRNQRWYNIVSQIGKISTEEYRELKKEYHWVNAFGIYKPMPENITEYEIKQLIKNNK